MYVMLFSMLEKEKRKQNKSKNNDDYDSTPPFDKGVGG